jgi:hypothetical protein
MTCELNEICCVAVRIASLNEICCVAVRIATLLYCLLFGIWVCTKYRWENLIVVRFGCNLGRDFPVWRCMPGSSNCGMCASFHGNMRVTSQGTSRVSFGLTCLKVQLYYLSTPWRHMWGPEVQLYSFLTSALYIGEWPASLTCCFAPGKELRGSFRRRLAGPHSRSVRLAGIRAQIFQPLT